MAGKLARVRWEMGQTLLPENFIAQEEALVTDTIMRFHMRGLPTYGIAGLVWNDTLLSEGVFSIQTITVVMPSGLLLDVPGNGEVSPFNLNIPGSVRVPVYCHIIQTSAEYNDKYQDMEQGVIPRIIYRLAISSEQSHVGAVETMKLAEFEKNPEGIWRLSPDFIPPLIQIGTSSFLKAEIDDLSETLDMFHYNLTLDAASYMSSSSQFSIQQCLKSVYHLQRFLANIVSQVHPHPYYVYEELNRFHLEVCFYKGTVPEHITSAYDHNQLAVCFQQILEPLKKQMQLAQTRSPYIPFEFKDGVYRITLPAEMREAKEVYFLIQKSKVNMKVNLDHLKLASISRISIVHKLALQGIPIKKVDQPGFQHSFGPEVDFYRISEGEEWDRALRELSAAFYVHPDFMEMEFYIYRR